MKVHKLLSSPDRWTQGVYARTAEGEECRINDEKAVCWCIYGAINKCYSVPGDREKAYERVRLALPEGEGGLVSIFNDAPERTYEEVYTLVKELDV